MLRRGEKLQHQSLALIPHQIVAGYYAEGCGVEWWDTREENEHAWKVRVDDVLKYDENKNLLSVNLDVRNPNGKEDLIHMPQHELAENILVKEKQIAELMDEIMSLLVKGS